MTAININPYMFRVYDIRGIVDKDLTEETVGLIGQSIGTVAQKRGVKKLITARDGRISGPVLLKALINGILSSGCDVIDIGAVTSPMMYFATRVLDTDSGVALTASHNPPEYNGIKVEMNGESFFGDDITLLYKKIAENKLKTGQGKLEGLDIEERYISRIVEDVKLDKPLHVVLDAGNGIAGAFASKLFRNLGCQVTELFCEVDGTFPNHHPDPSIEENLRDLMKAVKENNADIGLAFDGDGDRIGIVTNTGKRITSDRLLMWLAGEILKEEPHGSIVFDLKCSRYLAEEIQKAGGTPIMWKTGHAYIKQKMKETGALLGGEMSGHIYLKHRWYGFDDGLYVGTRICELLTKSDKTLDEIFKVFPEPLITPELIIPIDDAKKFDFIKKFQETAKFPDAQVLKIDGIRADFKDGFGQVRASNTTPILNSRFEGDTEAVIKRIQALFKKELLKVDPTLKIPF